MQKWSGYGELLDCMIEISFWPIIACQKNMIMITNPGKHYISGPFGMKVDFSATRFFLACFFNLISSVQASEGETNKLKLKKPKQ